MTKLTSFLDFTKFTSLMGKHYTKCLIFILFLVLGAQTAHSQVKEPFQVRYAADIRGELTFAANNIVSAQIDAYCTGNRRNRVCYPEQTPNDPYNLTGSASDYNDNIDMQYIDVDGDASTFSSSSAILTVPDATCSLVRYAGLYWSAVYVNSDRSTIDDIKFRMPGGAYQDITADEILFDGDGDTDFGYYSPYAAYKDVTNMLTGLADPNGEYTVANVRASTGSSVSGGISGGWTLVVVYENPNLPGSRYITTFDGYAGIKSGESVDIPINGFTTLPAPFAVNAKMGVAALEGDNRISGDGLAIDAFGAGVYMPLSNSVNPATNFFNSNITRDNALVTDRTPNSTNTLGWDMDLFEIDNQFNNVIPNDATSATLRASSSQDKYDIFFTSFDVEIIAPNIVLEKRVNTPGGDDITGLGVNLGQTLDYVLTYQNIGNDDGDNYTIRDILPVNVSPPDGRTDFIAADFSLPPGVTYVYNSATREVVFTIPNDLIEENDPAYAIRMRVQVAENCFDFINACSDLIQNLAYSTYQGVENSAMVTDDPSVTDFNACGFIIPGATNFLLDDLSDCNFERTVELCGNFAVLNAGDGFDEYIWYSDNNGNNDIDSGDTIITDSDPDNDPSTIVVTQEGTYIVDKIVADPCKGFKEIITVSPYGSGLIPNPIIEYFNDVNSDSDPSNDIAGEIVQCSVDSDLLPKLFLCGIDDTKLLQVNIVDAQSIVWEQLDEGSCSASGDDCANKALTCTWSQVGTGNNYTVNSEGQYRLSVTYQNGCTSRFYYNVFQNTLDIQYNAEDIICGDPGNITITNLGNGYGYQLVDAATNNILIPFSSNNGPSFDFNSGENGSYIVEVNQLDQTGNPIDGACVFSTPEIGILDRNVSYAVTANDATCNGLGSINIQINNADPNYEYELRLDDGSNGGAGTLIDNETAQPDNNFTFTGLAEGDYIVIARTDEGCSHTEQVSIVNNNDLALNARVSQHITCREGNILMDSGGGQTPHTYAIWQYVDNNGVTVTSYPTPQDIPSSEFQTSQIFDIFDPGDYIFVVVDRNNCFSFSNNVTIEFRPAAEFNPTSVIDVACFGDSSGTIQFNLIDDNGYQLTYYLYDENDVELATNTTGYFPNLPAGDYTIVINQRKGSASCDYTEEHTISAPSNAISATSTLIQDYTCLLEGIIEAQNVTGGTAPYEYSIDGVNFIPDSTPNAHRFENLTDGTYAITVRDAAGCTYPTDPITILPLNEPTDLTFVATAPNCPDLTSDVTVSVVGGNPNFTYEIVAPAGDVANNGNSNVFAGLDPGTYTFRVTDDKGCAIQEDFTITPVDRISVTGALNNNVTCFGLSDGSITYTLADLTGTYDYNVTGPANFSASAQTNASIPLTGLGAGTYVIAVTDNTTNCTDNASVTVAAPPAPLLISDLDVTDLTCSTTGTVPGSVVITATDGWGGYEYELEDPAGTVTGPQSTNSFTGLTDTSGNYTVTVRDAGGCEVTQTFSLNPTVAPVLEVTANSLCYDSTTGLVLTANVTSGGVAPFQYRLNGGPYQSNVDFTGLGPGSYNVEVIDSRNCTATTSIDVFPTMSASASLLKDLDCTIPPDAQIEITIAGGNPTFSYEVFLNGASFQANTAVPSIPFTYTTTTPGTYAFVITDSENCTITTNEIIVSDALPPVSLPVITDASCNGDSNGIVDLNISGGLAPYSIVFDGSAPSTQEIYTDLAAGSYNYSITDSKGCITNGTAIVNEPNALVLGTDITTDYDCTTGAATISVISVNGGTGPFEYSIDGVNFDGTTAFTGLLDGSYTITVRDANLCIATSTEVIDPLNEPTDLSFTQTAVICPALTSDVTVAVTNGNPNFIYEIVAPAGDAVNNVNNATFTGLAPGTYTFRVTDDKGCFIEEDYTIAPIDQVTAVSQIVSNVTCVGDSDGEFTFTVTDFASTYSYTVEDSLGNPIQSAITINTATPISVPGLAADTYVVNVIDDTTNCSITINPVISEPSAILDFTFTNTPVTCIENATITVTATGGWGNYEYELENTVGSVIVYAYNSNNQFTNVLAGTYNIYVRDANGCIDTKPITIDSAVAPTLALATSDFCYDSTDQASLTIDITDGVAPYSYSINGGGQNSVVGNQFTVPNLTPNTYNIIVTDAFGCTSNTITETIEPQLTANAVLTQDLLCTGNAIIDVTIANGYIPYATYQVQVDGGGYGAITPIVGNSFTYNGAAVAGTYQFLITDARNCTIETNEVIVTDALPATSTPIITHVTCNGDTNGIVDLNISGGSAPYSIVFDGSAPSTQEIYTDLAAGSYNYGITDSKGCVTTGTAVVNEPNALILTTGITTDYDCTSGAATISVTNVNGGTGPFEYSIDGVNFDGTTAFTGLLDGTYTITVRDANLCIATSTQVIDPLNEPTDLSFTQTAPTCPAIVSDVTVNVTDGNGPFTYEIIAPAISATNNLNNNVFAGLAPGTYTFRVTDDKGCSVDEDYTINPIPQVSVLYQLVSNVTCVGDSDGEFAFTVSDFVSTYSYTVEDSLGNPIQSANNINTTTPISVPGLAADTYIINVVDDTTNCDVSSSALITEPAIALDFTFTNTPVSCIENATINVTATGGWGNYEYELENTVGPAIVYAYNSNNQFTNVPAGTYNIYVRDANGCIDTKPITIDPVVTPTLALTTSDFCYDSTDQASLTIDITDGVAPYAYSINGGGQNVIIGNQFTVSNLTPDTYNIVVTDAFGCTSNTITETIEPQLTANAVLTQDLLCTGNAIIDVAIANGYTPYATYQIQVDGGGYGATTPIVGSTFTYNGASAAGTYQFLITDARGCTVETNEVVVEPTVLPQAIPVVTDVACFGGADGSVYVDVDANFGLTPYTISFNGSAFTSTTTYSGLAAGTYPYIVRDSKGCEFNGNSVVNEPLQILSSMTSRDVTCSNVPGGGNVLGGVDVTVTQGGVANFTYTLYDSANNIVVLGSGDPNPAVSASATHSFDGVDFGDYYVRIVDANGCESDLGSVRVRSNPYLSLTANIPPPDCPTGGTAIITATGGSGDYDFRIYDVGTLPDAEVTTGPTTEEATFNGLNPGQTYIIEATDNINLCTSYQEVVIPPLSTITALVDSTTDITCTGSDDGIMSFTVDNYDSGVNTIDWEILNAVTNTNVTGSGAYAGTVGPGPAGGPQSLTVNQIPPGDYVLLVREATAPSCTATTTFRITEPTPVALSLISQTSANCNDDAEVTVRASGGTSPYTYAYVVDGAAVPSSFPEGATFTLDPSVSLDWDVYAQDANLCISPVLNVTITVDPTPGIVLSIVDECVSEGTYAVDVTMDVAGVGPYRISVNGGSPQSAPGWVFAGDVVTVSNLSSGAHTIAIVDANGCGETENITIFPPLTALAAVSSDENCDPANTGEVTVTANGGSGVYTYTRTSPAGPSNGTGVFTGLTHSVSYTFEVEDTATNCIVPVTITLPAPELPTFSLSATDVSCFGGNDGTITVTLDPGNIDTPYLYSLDGGTTTQPTNVFTGLVAGTYNVTVISDKGCEDTKSIIVDEPSLLAISASASAYTCDDTASTITVTIDNDGTGNPSGTGPYLYSFDNGANFGTDNTYQVAYGSAAVNVVVEDSNGCQDTVSVPVPVMQEVTASINQLQVIDCNNGEEIIEIVALNGSGNYTYTQLPSGNVVADPANIVITAPGNYVYEITDTTTNCSVIVEHNVAPYDLIDAVATVTNDATCSDSTDGTIEVTVTGYVGTFEYEVRDGSGTAVTATITDNATADPYVFTVPSTFGAGTYTVAITATAYPECTAITNTVTIDAPEPLALTLVDVVNANCNVSDAVVTVLANGGTPAYTYGASQSGAGVPGSFTFDSTIELDPSVNLNWDIYVRDSNGCIISAPLAVTIAMDPTPGIVLSIVDECVSEGTYAVDVTMDVAGVGPYRISVNGGSPQSAPGWVFAGDVVTVSNLSSGAHTIAIVDANGCGETENISIEPELQISASVNTQPSCITNDGIIDFTVTGGSGASTVQLLRSDLTDTGLVPTANQFIGVAFGDYIVRVTDNTLGTPNCFADAPVSLEEPTPVTLLATDKTDVSCAGLSDGRITINLAPTSIGVNDNPPYVYEITDGTNTFTQNTGLFTGLPAGTYDITVTSNRNCIATDQVIIREPFALDAAITAVTELTCNINNGTQSASIEVTITTGTGTPNYFYSVNGGAFLPTGGDVFTYETTIAGNYDIVVRDQNGCPFPLPTQTIAPLNTFTANVTTLSSITCDVNNPEEVLITVTDDGNPHYYTFELLPIGNPNGVQTALTATTANYDLTAVGNYTFRITDTDTGCYVDTATYTIAPFDFIEVTATAILPVTCFGDGNGTLEFTISGYTGNYDYQVFDSNDNPIGGIVSTDTSVNPRTVGGLSGGNYYVTITETDVPLCDDNSNMVTIISPDMPLSATVDVLAEATCTNDQGEILIDPTGGYAPYDIVMTNTTTGQPAYTATDVQSIVFTGLSAGSFDITITDASGCPRSYTEVLNPATPIVANATPLITDLACYGDTGAIVSANVTGGGSGGYEYQLNYYDDAGTSIVFTTGQQLSPDFNDLGAGIYSITVSDGWNCDVTTNTVEVREPTPVEVFLIRTDPLTCATGAEFELTAIGGSGTYEYSTDNVTFMPMTSNPMGLPATGTFPAGTYQYYIRDAVNGCEAAISNAITEDPIDPLTLIVDQTAAFINCTGESTAVIYAEATGGLGNYQFELFTDASLSLATRIAGPQSQGVFRDLSAGTYYVTVISQDCTTAAEEVVIVEPTPLSYTESVIDVTCAGENDGEITVTLSGGAGGFQYAISPNLNQFFDNNTFTDLEPGEYTIIAQDQNGCFEYLTYTISEPASLVVSAETTPEICVDSQDGTIVLEISGGTAPYSTALNSSDDADFVLNRTEFIDMASGEYIIIIKDANGCDTNIVVEIERGVNLNATIEPIYECSGDTPSNYVNITVEDDSVIGDILYAIDSVDPADLQLNPDFRNTAPGSHYITIAHENGCIQTIDFVIEAFDPLTLSLEQRNMNEITAIAEGGREEYTYYFDDIDNGDKNTFYITRTDTYEVRVIDQNGCESIANIFMEFIDIELPNFFTPDGDGQNDFWIPRNMEQFPEILIKIFDRYGRVVSEQSADSEGWDGLYSGKELPTGDYWYVIKLNGERDEREFVGHFTLYR